MADRNRYRDQLQTTRGHVGNAAGKVPEAIVHWRAEDYPAQIQESRVMDHRQFARDQALFDGPSKRRPNMKRFRPNKEGIDKLIKVIKSPKKHFVMSSFEEDYRNRSGKSCGTAYCIAGWAAVLNGKAEDVVEGPDLLREMLAPKSGYLAFEHDDASVAFREEVFILWNGGGIVLDAFDKMPEKDRKAIAIEVLEHFAKTGKVEWRKIARKHGYTDWRD